MKLKIMRVFKTVVLILSALALFYASSTRLLIPSKAVFLKPAIENTENFLESNTDLINEIRGVGGVLLIAGIVVLFGVFNSRIRTLSIQLSSVIFSGIVLGRIISFGLEGIPSTEIIRLTSVEFFFSILNIFCLANMYLRRTNG